MENEKISGYPSLSPLDQVVGKIAGQIVSKIIDNAGGVRIDRMCLLPAIAFKVNRCLAKHPDFGNFSLDEIQQIGKQLRTDTESALAFFEVDAEKMKMFGPMIEHSVIAMLIEFSGDFSERGYE